MAVLSSRVPHLERGYLWCGTLIMTFSCARFLTSLTLAHVEFFVQESDQRLQAGKPALLAGFGALHRNDPGGLCIILGPLQTQHV